MLGGAGSCVDVRPICVGECVHERESGGKLCVFLTLGCLHRIGTGGERATHCVQYPLFVSRLD